MWTGEAILERLAKEVDLKPDLIVGHSGIVSTLFLREIYDCPIINYFEYFYRTGGGDFNFRHDLPPIPARNQTRARARNASILLDLENCNAGYAPTNWQRSVLPEAYRSKVKVVFDGIETEIWNPRLPSLNSYAGLNLGPETKVVTYVSRGLESMRGFDVFMRIADRLCRERKDVLVLVIGEDRIAYGGDRRFTQGKSFKEWVLSENDFNLDQIRFLGRIPPLDLARVLKRTDLHVYLTAPFVLSWSMMNALACGAVVLASDTPPVTEMIKDQQNGLLCGFFDVDGFVRQALQVLDDPAHYSPIGRSGAEMIEEHYSVEVCLPKTRTVVLGCP